MFVVITASCSKDGKYVEKVIVTDYKGNTREITSYKVENKTYVVKKNNYKVLNYSDISQQDESNYYFITLNLTYNVKIKDENKNIGTYKITLVANIDSMTDTMFYVENYNIITIDNNLKIKKLDVTALNITYITSVTDTVEIISI